MALHVEAELVAGAEHGRGRAQLDLDRHDVARVEWLADRVAVALRRLAHPVGDEVVVEAVGTFEADLAVAAELAHADEQEHVVRAAHLDVEAHPDRPDDLGVTFELPRERRPARAGVERVDARHTLRRVGYELEVAPARVRRGPGLLLADARDRRRA